MSTINKNQPLGGYTDNSLKRKDKETERFFSTVRKPVVKREDKTILQHINNMPTTQVGSGSDLELQEVADTLATSRKVVVITGAGISTNCGIPVSQS